MIRSRGPGKFTRSDVDEDVEPEERDLTTEDHVHFYQDGRLALTIQAHVPPHYVGERGRRTRDADEGEVSAAATWRQIERWMKREQFFPNVWLLDDHGGATLMSPPKRARKQSARARMEHALAVAAAEKRYGTDGPLIAGGLREHWPETVKNKIRRIATRK